MSIWSWIGNVNNLIGLATFGLTVAIWWRVRRIKRAKPALGDDFVLVVFDLQNNAAKLSSDLKAAGYDKVDLLIEASDALGSSRRPDLDANSDDFERLVRHFFEKIGPYSSRSIILSYNGPAALSFALGKLCANNYDIVQLHYDNDSNTYSRPPYASAEWRHWSG